MWRYNHPRHTAWQQWDSRVIVFLVSINISINVKPVYVIDVENVIKTREILDKIATNLLMDGPWGSTHIALLHDALLAWLPKKCFRIARLSSDYNISRGYRPGLSHLYDNWKHKYDKNLIYFQKSAWQLHPELQNHGLQFLFRVPFKF